MTWDNLHEQDILFDFQGTTPEELTRGRFYRGEVDGFAEFGVFVTLNGNVTGLLHRSKLRQRLESLDWDTGDEVIVEVEGVRDNGNVDLDWSIRQSPEEFRGEAIDDPDADSQTVTDPVPDEPEPTPEPATTPNSDAQTSDEGADVRTSGGQVVEAVASARTDELDELTGERVRMEGRITDIRQTSGPTVFTLSDEGSDVECAAFESAGVRAYPSIEEDDVVRLVGLVETHRGDIQIETESIETLDDGERAAVIQELEAAVREQAAPEDPHLLVEDPHLSGLEDEMVAVATRLRKAVLADRPVVVRHPPTVDGVVGGAAIERALRAALAAEQPGAEVDARTIRRRPMRDPWYDLGDAMYDLGVSADEQAPVVLLVGAGTTEQDRDSLEFLELYDVDRLVVDAFGRAADVADVTDAAVIADGSRTAATVAAHVAGMVAEPIREELAALPAISYRGDTPELYRDLAAERDVDPDTALERRQALALIAYFQRYDDKRELVADLLFDGEEAAKLAGHISAQYRERVTTAVETARANAERVGDGRISVLDAEAHSHRFDFPPRSLLAAELLDAAAADGVATVIVLGKDECHLASTADLDLTELAAAIAEVEPTATVAAARDRLTFLAGQRETVRERLVDAVSNQLA